MLDKLALYGLDNNFLKLIFSYLSGRSQRVSVNGTLSDEIMVTSGVPQSSVLGPLLFLVYIDDMLSVPDFSSCFCFADDTKLACAGEDMFNKCQKDLDKLLTWAADNDLTFNVDKCVYLQVSEICDSGLNIGSNLIRKVDKISDLGIEISSNLKWSNHVRTKLAKAQRSFNYLRHNVPYSIPNSVKYNLYSACVLSILLYGSQAWFADISHLRLLENFYWKGLRGCYGRNDYSTLLRASNNTPICYQLSERDLRFFISIVLGNTCIKFEDFFSIKTYSKMLRTNSHDHIVVSPTKKQLTAKSFFKQVQIYVNEFSDTGNFNILRPPAKYKVLLKTFFCILRDSKFNPDVTCSWSIKCR